MNTNTIHTLDVYADRIDKLRDQVKKLKRGMTLRNPSAEVAALREAVELLEFYEGSVEKKHNGPDAQPVIWINAEDFMTVLTKMREALGKDQA